MNEIERIAAYILFDMTNCGGCRTCEIACSFHHNSEFNPSISSIEIIDKKDKPGYEISISIEDRGKRIACDGCASIDIPLCIQYCKEKDELREMISEVNKYRNGSSNE